MRIFVKLSLRNEDTPLGEKEFLVNFDGGFANMGNWFANAIAWASSIVGPVAEEAAADVEIEKALARKRAFEERRQAEAEANAAREAAANAASEG